MKIKISTFHFLFGGLIGIGLLYGVIQFWPDGKLHIFFCDVGQGDAIYVRMPSGADLLVDGGPSNAVLSCLGRHMPFYDRMIDVVVMTHPQKDHLFGLIEVVKRYTVKYFVTVPVANPTETYTDLKKALEAKNIFIKYPTTGTHIDFTKVDLEVIWPESQWLNQTLSLNNAEVNKIREGRVLGMSTDHDLNIFSLYLHLKYGQFDLLLTGDGDSPVQSLIWQLGFENRLPRDLEVLKVPHHGSKTGMTDEFINFTRPKLSVIEVGKNSYGHPNEEIISKLRHWGKVMRTDKEGDIEVVSDGKSWFVKR